MQKLRYALIALLLTTLLACGGENKTSDSTSDTATVEQALAVGSVRFEPEFYPSRIGSREEYLKAIDSYWDGFNFATDSLVAMYDRRSVIEAFADYVIDNNQDPDSTLKYIGDCHASVRTGSQ